MTSPVFNTHDPFRFKFDQRSYIADASTFRCGLTRAWPAIEGKCGLRGGWGHILQFINN